MPSGKRQDGEIIGGAEVAAGVSLQILESGAAIDETEPERIKDVVVRITHKGIERRSWPVGKTFDAFQKLVEGNARGKRAFCQWRERDSAADGFGLAGSIAIEFVDEVEKVKVFGEAFAGKAGLVIAAAAANMAGRDPDRNCRPELFWFA